MPSPAHPQNFFRYFLLCMLALCLGGATLVGGLGAGRAVVARFFSGAGAGGNMADIGTPHFGPAPRVFAIACAEVDFTEAIETVRNAVVSITIAAEIGTSRGQPRYAEGSGSGFIFYLDENYAYIATNNHVVENASRIHVSLDDELELPARLAGAVPSTDLAILAVRLDALEESGKLFTVAVLGCSDSLRMGDSVVAMGNALGEGQRTTQGIVSALDLMIRVPNPNTGENLPLNVFQTDAAVNRGNSGGPLINAQGEVVGIITAKFMGAGVEGMGYVLPIDNVRDMLRYLREEASIIIPFMGIVSDEVNTEARREMFNLPSTGQWITRVTPNTPASEAGLQRGDLIVRFGQREINGIATFREALINSRVGETVVLGIYRAGEFMELEITLGAPR